MNKLSALATAAALSLAMLASPLAAADQHNPKQPDAQVPANQSANPADDQKQTGAGDKDEDSKSATSNAMAKPNSSDAHPGPQ